MKKLYAAIFMLSLAAAPSLQAGVGYIKGADVERGEFELEYQLTNSVDDTRSEDNDQDHKLEAGYGLTDSFAIAGGAKIGRSQGDDTDLETIFAEAIYQFIEADEHGFDMAVLGEYVHATETGKPDKIEAKLLFEREWGGHFLTKANLIAEREVGENRGDSIELGSKLGTVYEISEHFAPGLEWQAEYGSANDIGSINDEQEHFLGPVAYGELYELPNDGGEFEYEIGYLFGVTDPAPDGVIRFLIEYEMEF